jgi:hypothetical protein
MLRTKSLMLWIRSKWRYSSSLEGSGFLVLRWRDPFGARSVPSGFVIVASSTGRHASRNLTVAVVDPLEC